MAKTINGIVFLCTILFSMIVLLIFGVNAYAEDSKAVCIETERIQAFSPVTCSSNDVVTTVKWYVDGIEVLDNEKEYVPDVDDYEKWIEVRGFDSDGNIIDKDAIYFSKLPVIYINTDDGVDVTSKTETKEASMLIQGNEEYERQYNGDITIKVRGNTSSGFSQKPYKIKLADSTNLFGMGKNKHWVLLSNYLDQAAMRNKFGSELSAALGLVNMDMTWVDVVLNGEYAGLYVLGEHIRIGENRINIHNWENDAESIAKAVYKANKGNGFSKDDRDELENMLCEDFSWISTGSFCYSGNDYNVSDYYNGIPGNVSGGYVFEMSDEYDELSKFTTDSGIKVMLNKPEYLFTNGNMMSFVESFWQDFENSIASDTGYDKKGLHYSEYSDFDSMVAYWLTMEITGNNDAIYKSRYAYKDLDGKLIFGPAWDFDWGCGSFVVGNHPKGWKVSTGTLWRDFVDDPYFQVKASEKYREVRDTLELYIEDGGKIDGWRDYLIEAGTASCAIYSYTGYYENKNRDFESDVSEYKNYLSSRIEWLDEQFASDDSISLSLSGINSSRGTPYIKQDSRAMISISEGLGGSGICPLILTVNVNNAVQKTERYEVQINGKITGSAGLTENGGFEAFSISENDLNEPVGRKNVIAVTGRNSLNEITFTNYVTAKLVNGGWIIENNGGGDKGIDYNSKNNTAPEDDISDAFSSFHSNDGSGVARGTVSNKNAAWIFDPEKSVTVIVVKQVDISKKLEALTKTKEYDASARHRYTVDDKKKGKINKKGIFKPKKRGQISISLEQKVKGGRWTKIGDPVVLFIQMPKMQKKDEKTVAVGETLDAFQYLSHTTYRPNKWISTKPDVASIDENTGIITVHKKGTTKIIAEYGKGKNGSRRKYATKLKIVINR